jgi:hypothetical protein
MTSELKMNQCRHMILAIAGGGCEEKTNIDLTHLLKMLARNSTSEIRDICKKLLKDKHSYLNQDTWMFKICWKLSLDKTENLTLL